MQKMQNGQVKLYPPARLWRILSEKRITISDCVTELQLAKVAVSRRSLQNWFKMPEGEMPCGKWVPVEAVLAGMVGR